MTTSGAVRAIRERSMRRMRAERDPDRAVAYALAGLWDAIELLSNAIDDDVDPRAKQELERLVRSLPVRLASVEDDALATAAVADHLAEVLQLDPGPRRSRSTDHGGGRRRCGG